MLQLPRPRDCSAAFAWTRPYPWEVSRPGAPVDQLRGALPSLATRMVDLPGAIDARPSIFLIDAPTADVSSTGIRQRVATGASIDGLVPPAVAAYIARHGLYRQQDR